MKESLAFEGQIALVTGGASGIGAASVERLIQEGARAIVWDIDAERLERTQAKYGDRVLTQKVDVTDVSAIHDAIEIAVRHFGKLDILVNSAGIIGPSEPFWEHSDATWRRVLDINLTAVFQVSKAAVRHLMANGYGRIVNLASISGKEGNANQAAYSTSKAGVIGLTKSMGKDLVAHNILVNAIAPASVQSELLAQMTPEQIKVLQAKIPLGRAGTVEEIAAMVRWLASSECSFCTGAIFDASGGRATY
ncbi:NAD(P)-dependent dehydrogenase (short-subunit alcohol dehydrogenase family) [Paraburkholderia sp. GAS199]|uniref:SDR family NAD(P)-dependent oxidoreductase n=1 Tax=Paraburkholderia sp. GAS199 TaxID=3035126 RepID=UPI003D22ED05